MSLLNLEPNFSDPDSFYAALTDLHRGLDAQASERINVRLILILANQIGDQATLLEAMRIATEEE